jgi:peptidyl-prolyl cis-trans isomerase A (cyclophilin A)
MRVLAAAAVFTVAGCKAPDTAPPSASSDTKPAESTVAPPPEPKKVEPPPLAVESKKTESPLPTETAPDKFAVKLTTTKGDIIIDVERNWTPNGVDRFYTLLKSGFYTDVAFFRVLEGFMAQVGISGTPELNAKWRKAGIQDDKVIKSNTRGMVTFAMSGRPNSRTTQFFINIGDNANLDGMGFAPFGKVRDMKTVDALYNGYGEGAPSGMGPDQTRAQREGNEYLKKEFPKLDYILKAEIL